MDNEHELYHILQANGISQAQIQEIMFYQMQNKKDQPVVKSIPKIQSKLVIPEPIKIQKNVKNQQNQLPPEYYEQAFLIQQRKQFEKLKKSKLTMPEPIKKQKIVKNQLLLQFQDQALLKLQIKEQERLQLQNRNKNKNKVKEIQQKPKSYKNQDIIYQPQHQLPAQFYSEQILKFQQQILQKLKLNRVKSESQANYGRSQNILQNKKKLSQDFEVQQQQQQQQQIDENQYVSYDYQPQQQQQQYMHQQQKPYHMQLEQNNFFVRNNRLNLMINSNNQQRHPKLKQKDRDLIKLLTGPKVIITNFYANFRHKLYQIPFLPQAIVLSTKPGYEGFIQLITLDQKCQIKLQQIDKIIYSKQLNQIYIYYVNPIKVFKKSQQNFWDRVETYFAFDQFKDQIILKSLIHKQFVIKLKTNKIDEAVNQIKKVYNQIKQVYKIQENFNHVRQLFNKYSVQRFMHFFQRYTLKNPIHCQQIQYSLISLLYMNHQIDIESIFQFGRYLKENYHPNTEQIYWKIITSLHPSSLYGDLRNYKSLSGILKATMQQQQIRKIKNISQKLIKCPSFKITPSGIIPSGWSIDNRNRLVRHFKDYDYQFMKIQISDDDEQKSNLFQCRTLLKPLFEKLLSEIRFLKNTYIPLGWTQSQLKSASMWYTLNSSYLPLINRQQLLYFLGDFTKFQSNPALKAARVGQNLSSIAVTVDVEGVKTETIPDLKSSSELLYTDGIGSISMDVTLKIQKKLTTKATAFQIRYRGCKGMLVLNRNLPHNTILVRKSMQKFMCPNKQSWKYLDIIAKNSYGAGYINHQIIILLSTNKIPNKVFFELQDQFIQNQLKNQYLYQNFQGKTSFQCNKDIFQIQSIGEIMNRIIKIDNQFIFKQPTLRGVLTEKHFHMFQRLIKKGHIRVQKSARLLGIIDEYNILEQGQVYCCIAKNEDQKYNVAGKCMLTKNPCMHPADIRVVKCITNQQAAKRFNKLNRQNYFDQLPNLVIFPQKGRIPITAQISGSDLDGDQFYISWDERLVPKQQLQPYIIDQVRTKQRIWNGTGYDQVIKFFCQFIFNNQLGRMANCHLVWADNLGAHCQQCLNLCKQYGKALDYAKKGYEFSFDRQYWVTKYPHFLQKPQKQTYKSKSILGKLYDESIRKYKNFKDTMREMQYQVYSFKGFKSQNYCDEQIRSAFRVIISFQKDFNYMVKHNRFQRQSQIYCLKLNENQKKSKYQIAERKILQNKYFHKFFFGLHKIDDPIEYYTAIRQNKSPIKQIEVQKKLILWYQISNYPIQKKVKNPDNKLRNWIERIEKLCQIYRDSISAIGLLWFCVPSLMFQLFRQE